MRFLIIGEHVYQSNRTSVVQLSFINRSSIVQQLFTYRSSIVQPSFSNRSSIAQPLFSNVQPLLKYVALAQTI
jgi:hypothetical protein